MKESYGAAGIFTIVVTFIVLFTIYLSVSVNYAKAFKIKNHVISIIEENNGYTDSGLNNTQSQIEKYLVAQRYTAHGKTSIPEGWKNAGCVGQSSTLAGDCMATIFEVESSFKGSSSIKDPICDDNTTRTYYKVVTYFNFVLPIINVNIPFRVSGDTGTICKVN